jgi:hypothetical protein
MPRNAEESRASFDPELFRLLRVWPANRGVWEAIVGAGPTLAIPATDADVDRYVDAYQQFIPALTGLSLASSETALTDRLPEPLCPKTLGQTATERDPVSRPRRAGRTRFEIPKMGRRLDE